MLHKRWGWWICFVVMMSVVVGLFGCGSEDHIAMSEFERDELKRVSQPRR